jgi:hypothetical protein
LILLHGEPLIAAAKGFSKNRIHKQTKFFFFLYSFFKKKKKKITKKNQNIEELVASTK